MMDLGWDGQESGGLRIYAPSDYHLGFLVMIAASVLAVVGATRIRETRCRNTTITE
jgi:hypothetical protein